MGGGGGGGIVVNVAEKTSGYDLLSGLLQQRFEAWSFSSCEGYLNMGSG